MEKEKKDVNKGSTKMNRNVGVYAGVGIVFGFVFTISVNSAIAKIVAMSILGTGGALLGVVETYAQRKKVNK